jgi:hypothetical protein
MLIDHPIENCRRGGDASAIFAREAALADSDGFPEPEQADFCLRIFDTRGIGAMRIALIHNEFHGPPGGSLLILTNHNPTKRTTLHVVFWHP